MLWSCSIEVSFAVRAIMALSFIVFDHQVNM
jgi:hypothetical protein